MLSITTTKHLLVTLVISICAISSIIVPATNSEANSHILDYLSKMEQWKSLVYEVKMILSIVIPNPYGIIYTIIGHHECSINDASKEEILEISEKIIAKICKHKDPNIQIAYLIEAGCGPDTLKSLLALKDDKFFTKKKMLEVFEAYVHHFYDSAHDFPEAKYYLPDSTLEILIALADWLQLASEDDAFRILICAFYESHYLTLYSTNHGHNQEHFSKFISILKEKIDAAKLGAGKSVV